MWRKLIHDWVSKPKKKDLAYYIKMLESDNAQLLKVLSGLVKVNEEWNDAMIAVAGRPPNWTDAYLDEARSILDEKTKTYMITEKETK